MRRAIRPPRRRFDKPDSRSSTSTVPQDGCAETAALDRVMADPRRYLHRRVRTDGTAAPAGPWSRASHRRTKGRFPVLKNDSSPSYEQLFGELDFRTDDDGRSVYSPAAYLVE